MKLKIYFVNEDVQTKNGRTLTQTSARCSQAAVGEKTLIRKLKQKRAEKRLNRHPELLSAAGGVNNSHYTETDHQQQQQQQKKNL